MGTFAKTLPFKFSHAQYAIETPKKKKYPQTKQHTQKQTPPQEEKSGLQKKLTWWWHSVTPRPMGISIN
jgi:hypothetical protein